MPLQATLRNSIALIVFLLAGTTAMAGNGFFSGVFGSVRGSGNTVTKEITVSEFERIKSQIGADISVVVGEARKTTITFDDNLIDLIDLSVRGNTLHITSSDSYSSRRSCKIVISVPHLSRISSHGSGDIEVTNLDEKLFDFRLYGSGDITLKGRVGELEIVLSGSGDIDACKLEAREATVELNGSGDVAVRASDWFSGEVNGSGDIVYYGNPDHTSEDVSGSGSIRSRG